MKKCSNIPNCEVIRRLCMEPYKDKEPKMHTLYGCYGKYGTTSSTKLWFMNEPKIGKPVFVGEIESDIKEYLNETLKSLDMNVIAMEVMSDHIHLLVDCKPQLRLSDAIKILKDNTARWLFLNRPEIKSQLWGGHLWNPSYFVATVSDRSLEQVTEYINSQKTK